jgi:hypothetical protein
MIPPRLPMELISAMPVAAAVRLRNSDGNAQNSGRDASNENAMTQVGSSTHQVEPVSAIPATPAAATIIAIPQAHRRSAARSENQPTVTMPIAPTIAGMAVTKPVSSTDRPMPLMICGRK